MKELTVRQQADWLEKYTEKNCKTEKDVMTMMAIFESLHRLADLEDWFMRYIAIESNTMCGDNEHWWQVRDQWDKQTLLGYYYEAGAKKMAAALNANDVPRSEASDFISEYGQSGMFDGRQ